MLKRLRIKFVSLIMGVAAVILLSVCVAVCTINYQQDITEAVNAMDQAISQAQIEDENGSESRKRLRAENLDSADIPDLNATNAANANIADAADDANTAETANSPDASAVDMPDVSETSGAVDAAAPPRIGAGARGEDESSIPVAVYVDNSGTLVATLATAQVSEDLLEQAQAELENLPDGWGTLTQLGLFYEKRSTPTATYIAFVDITYVDDWKNLALALAGISLIALAVLFAVSLLFSRWALRPVQDAWTQQRRFVADASHDLKTPLTVILANSAIMMENPKDSVESQTQWLQSTVEEAENMQALVNDLLLLARMDETEDKSANRSKRNGAPAIENAEPIDISRIVSRETLQFESLAFEKNLSYEVTILDGLHVRGDANKLRRLVQTLLDNAFKYVNKGGLVRVEILQADGNAVLKVHNTGEAIAPDKLPHIFDRFYRADEARTTSEGHGLGLSIAASIAEAYGGSIDAESFPYEGTTLIVKLPLATPCALEKFSGVHS